MKNKIIQSRKFRFATQNQNGRLDDTMDMKNTIECANNLISDNKWNLGKYRIDKTDTPETIRQDLSEPPDFVKPTKSPKFTENDDINKILSESNGFALFGQAGRGKTYMVVNTIIPELTRLNKTFKVTSLSHKEIDNIRSMGRP